MDPKVIVSLTTHDLRLTNGTVERVIKNIIDGTFKELRVVLTLYKDDESLIPASLRKMIDDGSIELIVSDINLRPHLKYFYAMQKYRNLPVITIDDDILYPDDMVEKLYKKWTENPRYIIARRSFPIVTTYYGELTRYATWMAQGLIKSEAPLMAAFPTGVGGILYPPDCLQLSDADIPEINTILTDDDFYLKAIEVRKGIRTITIEHNEADLYKKNLDDPVTQSIALFNQNAFGGSDRSICQYYKEFLTANIMETRSIIDRENADFIVSVTSFGIRMNKMLPIVLLSLSRQTIQNFKVVLTLNTEDFWKIEDPYLKWLIQNEKIEVLLTEDHLKCHLKYICTMKENPDMPIVTIDDDTILHNTALEELWNGYKNGDPNTVYARQVFEFRGFGKTIIGSRIVLGNEDASHKFVAEGFCGILYPPKVFGSFYDDLNEQKKIKELITDDDIYLKGLEIRKGVKVKCVRTNTAHMIVQLDLGTELEKTSLHEQYNSDQQRMKNFERIRDELSNC